MLEDVEEVRVDNSPKYLPISSTSSAILIIPHIFSAIFINPYHFSDFSNPFNLSFTIHN